MHLKYVYMKIKCYNFLINNSDNLKYSSPLQKWTVSTTGFRRYFCSRVAWSSVPLWPITSGSEYAFYISSFMKNNMLILVHPATKCRAITRSCRGCISIRALRIATTTRPLHRWSRSSPIRYAICLSSHTQTLAYPMRFPYASRPIPLQIPMWDPHILTHEIKQHLPNHLRRSKSRPTATTGPTIRSTSSPSGTAPCWATSSSSCTPSIRRPSCTRRHRRRSPDRPAWCRPRRWSRRRRRCRPHRRRRAAVPTDRWSPWPWRTISWSWRRRSGT